MSKLPKPTKKQFSINPKGNKQIPEELKTMTVRKRKEEIEEKKEWDKE